MEMSSANEIRYILNEIDKYKKYLKDMEDCTKLSVTIHDGYNGSPTTFSRNGMEVEAIIKAYKEHIEALTQRIEVMRWVEAKPE